MKDILEKLWDEYFAETCAVIDTEDERKLSKKATDMHGMANAMLTKEQSEAIEAYIDVLCELQGSFVKKAFFKGSEFAVAFMLKIAKTDRK